MPRTKSAKKQMRQAVGRTARNKSQRSALRTAVKKLRGLLDNKEDGKVAFLEAEKQLDRAGRKGLIHPNTAARHKSRLAKRVKS
ncbi:MAG TPA: 30S ribosomal protein S20 [Gemmatimonadales bacterium]|nr:30S ribosomal protein S20 [Gemmatimonadales bacterium]